MEQFSLDKYLANPSRKVITRDGRKVTRILCTDAKGKYPIIALIWIHGEERVYSFTKNGCWSKPGEESVNDLFFAPEKHEGWVNLYKYANKDCAYYMGSINNSKAEAENKRDTSDKCIATIKIEWEE